MAENSETVRGRRRGRRRRRRRRGGRRIIVPRPGATLSHLVKIHSLDSRELASSCPYSRERINGAPV
jgi:hypothetical protein